MNSYKFGENTLPNLVYEPLKSLSIISHDPDFITTLGSSDKSCFTGTTNQLLKLIESINSLQPSYFALTASSNDCKLSWNSQNTDSLFIDLTEYAIHHHAYLQRYLKLRKRIPPKGSYGQGVRYDVLAKRQGQNYSKDLDLAISQIFENTQIQFFLDVPFSLSLPDTLLTEVVPKISVRRLSQHTDLTPLRLRASGGKDTERVPLVIIDQDLAEDFLEYLSLLHMNAFPDYTNPHVSATCMYTLPDLTIPVNSSGHLKLADSETPGNSTFDNSETLDVSKTLNSEQLPLYTVLIQNVNPRILFESLKSTKAISVLATTSTSNCLSLASDARLYIWETHR